MDAPPECSGHSHDHGDHGDDLGQSLRKYVDVDRVVCLNEEVNDSGKAVLSKLHEDRLSAEPTLVSPDGDPELLLHIPFTEAVTIKSITIRNGSDNAETASPRKVKLFTNRENLDFETARELPSQQDLHLLPTEHLPDGCIDYPCRPAGRFQNISCLSILVLDNYDFSNQDDTAGTEITYVGFKGSGSSMKRTVVDAVYEVRGMPEDHKVPDEFKNPSVL